MITEVALSALISIGLAAAATPGEDTQFVKQLYSDVLGRSANRLELSKWVTFLENGGARVQVSGALTSSQEYRKLLIDQIYADYLNRAPSPDELAFWSAWLQQGATDDQLRIQLLGSDEFYNKAGASNLQFLQQLWEKVMGAVIDNVTLAFYNQVLSQGTPRTTIAEMVLSSLAAEQYKVEQWSVRFLRTSAVPAMLPSYIAVMKAGATDEQIIDLILASDAYFSFSTHRH